jgi:L-serine kinase (ADP)
MTVVLRPLMDIKPHEQVRPDHVLHIMRSIQKDQAVKRPLIVARTCQTLLDGHHRYDALRKLGARYAPCVEVDYDDPDEIEVTAWRDDESITPRSVRDAAARGEMMPPKTSRHLLKSPVSPIRVPLVELVADESDQSRPAGGETS